MDGIQGLSPLVEVQEAKPPGGARGNAPSDKKNGPGVTSGAVISPAGKADVHFNHPARMASHSSATMLAILIIGFTAGPAVSL